MKTGVGNSVDALGTKARGIWRSLVRVWDIMIRHNDDAQSRLIEILNAFAIVFSLWTVADIYLRG
jgi:hypothetical protein